MLGRKAALSLLMLAFAVLVAVYMGVQLASEPCTDAGTAVEKPSAAFSIPPLPDVNATLVGSVEEAARLMNVSTPIRLPTVIPEELRCVKMMVLDGRILYVFYSDEPMPDTDNPILLIRMLMGAEYDIAGAAPEMAILVWKVPLELAPSTDRESVEEYVEKFNLSVSWIGDVPVTGYSPPDDSPWKNPTGVASFYMKGLDYEIISHLSFEEMVEVARSIIEAPSNPQPPGEEEPPFSDPVLSKLWERTVKRLRPHYEELGINLCGLLGNGTLVVGLPVEATDEDLARVEERVREIVGDDIPILVARARFIEDALS